MYRAESQQLTERLVQSLLCFSERRVNEPQSQLWCSCCVDGGGKGYSRMGFSPLAIINGACENTGLRLRKMDKLL